MINNDILRRIRYMFNFSDSQMIAIFKLVEYDIKKEDLLGWLRKEDDPLLVELTDKELSTFLNGLIIEKRGRREGPLPEAEDPINNNIILRKMKIALDLKTDDILDLFDSVDFIVSKHELSAFFRRPDHRSYRQCMDQFLRTFFNALQLKYRGKSGEGPKHTAEPVK